MFPVLIGAPENLDRLAKALLLVVALLQRDEQGTQTLARLDWLEMEEFRTVLRLSVDPKCQQRVARAWAATGSRYCFYVKSTHAAKAATESSFDREKTRRL